MKKITVVLIAFCLVFSVVKNSNAFVISGAAAATALGMSQGTALMASITGHAAVIAVAGYYGGKKYMEYKAGDEDGNALNEGKASDGTGIEGEVVNILDLQADSPDMSDGSNISEYFDVSTMDENTVLNVNGKYYVPNEYTTLYEILNKSCDELCDLDSDCPSAGDMRHDGYVLSLVVGKVTVDNQHCRIKGYEFYDIQDDYSGPKDVKKLSGESIKEKYPDEFEDQNMLETLRNDGQPHTYVGEIKDSTTKEPDKTLSITGSLGNGKFVTDTGRVIDVSGQGTEIQSAFEDVSPAEFDQDSVSDKRYKSNDGQEGVMDSSTGQDLQDQGVQGDVTGQDGNTIYWEDSNGTEHATSVDDDTAEDVAEGAPDGIRDSWESSGQDGEDPSKELDIGSGDIGDAPGEGDVPGFEGVKDEDLPGNAKEKKDFPFSDWQGFIPFYGVLSESGFSVSGTNPVVSMNLQLGPVDKQLNVDFSQWSGILEVMGTIIYLVASFYAIRYALFD